MGGAESSDESARATMRIQEVLRLYKTLILGGTRTLSHDEREGFRHIFQNPASTAVVLRALKVAESSSER